jgi:hypothetical protein
MHEGRQAHTPLTCSIRGMLRFRTGRGVSASGTACARLLCAHGAHHFVPSVSTQLPAGASDYRGAASQPRALAQATALSHGTDACPSSERSSYHACLRAVATRAPQHVGEPSVIAATLDAVPPAGEAPTSDAQPRIADSRLETPSAPAASDELRRARQSPPFVASAVEWLQQSVAQLTLRSDEQSQTPWLRLRTPDIESNSAIEPGVVVFEWTPVDNAKGYRVRLIQANRAEPVVDVALEVGQTRLAFEQPLRPGEYTLTIVVEQEGRSRVFRRNFYVLSTEQQRALRWARENAERYPLLSAAVFYENDRYTDALRCLERASREYPNDRLVAAWRKQVEARIRQRVAEFEE